MLKRQNANAQDAFRPRLIFYVKYSIVLRDQTGSTLGLTSRKIPRSSAQTADGTLVGKPSRPPSEKNKIGRCPHFTVAKVKQRLREITTATAIKLAWALFKCGERLGIGLLYYEHHRLWD